MTDKRTVQPIAYCECCGARVRLSPIHGVWSPGLGFYCVPCEYAIVRAGQAEPTKESRAFVARLAARAEVDR